MKKIRFTREEMEMIEKVKDVLENKWNEASIESEEYRLIKNAFFAIDEIAVETNSDGVLDI